MVQGKAVEHVPFGTVRTDVFGAREMLAEKAVHLRLCLAHQAPLTRRDAAQAAKKQQAGQREDGEADPGEDVFVDDDHEHAHEQYQVREHVHDEPRKEGRERGHVAVDPLDELARRARLVKAQIKAQAMQHQVCAQRIRRGPAEVLTDVLRTRREDLVHQRDGDERDRDEGKRIDFCTARRAVDERAQQLRIDELQRDAREKQDAEQHGARPAWTDVVREQLEVAACGWGHS